MIKSIVFLPNEGRVISATVNGWISLFELDASQGTWVLCSEVRMPFILDRELLTCMALGCGIIYVGSNVGTLRQIAVKCNRLFLGDDVLTTCTSAMISESLPLDKRDQLNVDTAIVSIELQPEGDHIIIAYAGGCVVVAVPQSVPAELPAETVSTDFTVPTAEGEELTPTAEDSNHNLSKNETDDTDLNDNKGDKSKSLENAPKSVPVTPSKGNVERRATINFKALTRGFRTLELSKVEKDPEPVPQIPPAPLVSHFLLRDQQVEWASWRVVSEGSLSTEVIVAYADGAFQVWPIVANVSKDIVKPMVVAMRDPPSIPYGPLPCGAIKKICVTPGQSGTLTAFFGGLPRPQFENRHAVSLLQDHENHVCFEFGSQIQDFLLVPAHIKRTDSEPNNESSETDTKDHQCKPSKVSKAATLLVLTSRELVAIDLTQPNWPAYESPYLNCLDSSPITTISHIGQVPTALIQQLLSTAHADNLSELTYSKQWPVWAGISNQTVNSSLSENLGNDLIGLGHANGWITLWSVGRGDALFHLGTIPTNCLYNSNDFQQNGMKASLEEETWPPFRSVGYFARSRSHGCYCPDQADSRLAIVQLKMQLNQPVLLKEKTDTEELEHALTLVVGQAGGQVSLWVSSVNNFGVPFEPDVSLIRVNLIPHEDEAKYNWKDLPALKPVEGIPQYNTPTPLTFNPHTLVQMNPPSSITSIALNSSWNVLAIGSLHGFALIDMINRTLIHTNFTYSPTIISKTVSSVSNVQNVIKSRGKQITTNMRQSFRRLKNFRTSASLNQTAELDSSANKAANDEVKEPTQDGEEKGDEIEPKIEPKKVGDDESQKKIPETPTTVAAESTPESSDEKAPTEVKSLKEHTVKIIETDLLVYSLSNEDDHTYSMSPVTCLLFADTFVRTIEKSNSEDGAEAAITTSDPAVNYKRTPTLWIGTGSGKVYVYELTWSLFSGPVKITLHTEIQLRHQAQVIGLCIVDTANHYGPIDCGDRTRISCIELPSEPISETADKPTTDQPEEATKSRASTLSRTPQCTHQLLICSMEQVKLFQLPQLRSLYKHKFVDYIRHLSSTGSVLSKSFSHGKSTQQTQSCDAPVNAENDDAVTGQEQAPEETKVTNEPNVEQETPDSAAVEKPEVMEANEGAVSNIPVQQPNPVLSKHVIGFGLQNFVTDGQSPKSDWDVVVCLRDGQTAILSLPNLRKVFKGRCRDVFPRSSQVSDKSLACVSSYSKITNVFWVNESQLSVIELQRSTLLNSLTCAPTSTAERVDVASAEVENKPVEEVDTPTPLQEPTQAEPPKKHFISIQLPDWVRPRHKKKAVDTTVAQTEQPATDLTKEKGENGIETNGEAAGGETNGEHVNGVENGSEDTSSKAVLNGKAKSNDANLSNGNGHASDMKLNQGSCDITLDSINEYMNGNEFVSNVKTTELSTEKRTIVEAGKITTTVREVEKVDGKLVKNDMVKIVTDGEPEMTVISGNV